MKETFVASVRDLTSDGRGVISDPKGVTYFVPGVWLGEEGIFRETPSNGKTHTAELVEHTTASDGRTEAPCPHHGHSEKHCGGCPWQFMSYEEQLKQKHRRVILGLERIQKDVSVLPILGAEKTLGYRNRAQFKTNGEHIGYIAENTNTLVPIENCAIITEKNKETLQQLLSALPNKTWKQKQKYKKGQRGRKLAWTTLDIDETIDAKNVSVNKRLPFQQGNSSQNMVMQSWLREKLSNEENKAMIVELFSGSGNFTQIIAENADSEVIATEIDNKAIGTLKRRGLKNVSAHCINLYKDNELLKLAELAKPASVMVLDPPRDGMKNIAQLVEKLKGLESIYYISCHLATFTRDAVSLQKEGFLLQDVQPIDLFPHTPHIELMARFGRHR